MSLYSLEAICGLTGLLPATLRNWKRAGLITQPQHNGEYTSGQLTRIYSVLDLTATGSTLPEIYAFLQGRSPLPQNRWQCRQEEMTDQLRDSSDLALQARMRQMGSDYSGDDFVNAYLKPLNLLLRSDNSADSVIKQSRFHDAVVFHARCIMRASERRKTVPVFLEAISVTDATEIWLEAIRLTGQGCRVEISENVTGLPATSIYRHDHHMMWCGAGISQLMQWNYREKLRNNKPVMLSGPDRTLLTAA
ncbi:MerR family transcriptional regulator [Pantoea sp. Bo_7]|uniref:MerR family transcriptional regulator n=1 Tax=unclassified Pantoea TaxID=2630326 RepID=UPI001231D71F|nr:MULTISPECIES: MerR family transcriptional regulator [unclassified Pantoea]KAA6043337.1 MerR family transcriptional regulator [Pantoea sp. Bo_7]KAA6088206.1 MerR family transcriptional regulator [Pantoea sp. Bo_10]